MSRIATIASLVRNASRSEQDFYDCIAQVCAEETPERIAEFFDKLNIPRSVAGEDHTSPLPSVEQLTHTPFSFEEEQEISNGVQKFLDRHEKKLKWHATRPSMEGAPNVVLLFRTGIIATEVRLRRLHALLRTKDELSPNEWAVARELMNRSYLSFRNYLNHVAGAWVDAMLGAVDREEFMSFLGNFYEVIDEEVRRLEEHRSRIEARRAELTVLPEGYDPVKPPIYFGGDLLGRGPWKQFWVVIENRSHHFREAVA